MFPLLRHPHETLPRLRDKSLGSVDVPTVTLPLELYRPIIEEVKSKKDLYNLLFVSRYISLEAERILYCTNNFQGPFHSSRPRFPSRFLKHISLCDRVAAHVRDLAVEMFPPSTLKLLEQALKQMCNLRKLILTTRELYSLSFSGCCFQLDTLVMRGVYTDNSAFLETQKELTELEIFGYSNLSFSSDAFPKLVILSALFPGYMYFVNNRPLRALYLLESPPAEIQLRQNVRSLCVPFSGSPEDFSALVEAFPSLRYLRINLDAPRAGWANFVQAFFTVLSPLESLEKLNFHMCNDSSEEEDGIVASENCFDILKNIQVFAFESFNTWFDLAVEESWSYSFRMEWVRGTKDHKDYPKNDDEWKDSRWC